MKDPDLLGNPNYTIHTGKKYQEEKKGFATVKGITTLVISIAAFILVRNGSINWGTDEPVTLFFYNIFWLIICCVMPFIVGKLVADLINYIGNRTNARYIEKTIPVELRLYDDCAVKYISEGRHEVYIQMPYENVRRCRFFSNMNTVSFAGRFTKVSFLETDKDHIFPKYETVTTVTIPGTYDTLSEITSHSPIEIYKAESTDIID